MEGAREGNIGKRTFGKLCNNSSYGSFGLNWYKYSIKSHDKSNFTIASFIVDYAKLELLRYIGYIKEKNGKLFYCDTDGFDTNIELPSEMINSQMGGLKYEGSFDRSIYLGKKQYYLLNTMSGKVKIGSKGYNKTSFTSTDWVDVSNGSTKSSVSLHFEKKDYIELRKVFLIKEFKLSLRGRRYDSEGLLEPLYLENSSDKRVKASLRDTELDISSLRLKCYKNSKIPISERWTRGILEETCIADILSDHKELNYSIRDWFIM